jgi:hypothetical protein
MTQQARRGSEDQDGVGTFMINGLAVPAVQQPTFGVAQRNQQVRPPALDFASALAYLCLTSRGHIRQYC